jgi:hypothetical protein
LVLAASNIIVSPEVTILAPCCADIWNSPVLYGVFIVFHTPWKNASGVDIATNAITIDYTGDIK